MTTEGVDEVVDGCSILLGTTIPMARCSLSGARVSAAEGAGAEAEAEAVVVAEEVLKVVQVDGLLTHKIVRHNIQLVVEELDPGNADAKIRKILKSGAQNMLDWMKMAR